MRFFCVGRNFPGKYKSLFFLLSRLLLTFLIFFYRNVAYGYSYIDVTNIDRVNINGRRCVAVDPLYLLQKTTNDLVDCCKDLHGSNGVNPGGCDLLSQRLNCAVSRDIREKMERCIGYASLCNQQGTQLDEAIHLLNQVNSVLSLFSV